MKKKDIIRSIFKQDYVSYQIRSEILDIVFNLRPTARFILNYNNQALFLAKFLINLNLKISISKGYVLHDKNRIYQDWFNKKKGNRKMVCFYISKRQLLAENSRDMDETKNDQKFGSRWRHSKPLIFDLLFDGLYQFSSLSYPRVL